MRMAVWRKRPRALPGSINAGEGTACFTRLRYAGGPAPYRAPGSGTSNAVSASSFEIRGAISDRNGSSRTTYDLVMLAVARVMQQVAHVHFERRRQPLQRGQGRHRLAVLDLRDVGAGHLHPAGKLPLRKIAAAPGIAHRARHLQTALFRLGLLSSRGRGRHDRFGLFHLQGLVAPPAEGIIVRNCTSWQ